MKGIILAGGKGTRLHPLTLSVSKQLMPIYDKPMIYYPLSTLISSGIREILIISTPEDLPLFERLLGDGSQWGCIFMYKEQSSPKGIAEAFLIGEEFIQKDTVALILGDNLFYGQFINTEFASLKNIKGGHIFAYPVKDPKRYGVIEFDSMMNVVGITEKPEKPKSSYVVPGVYFYDTTVIEKAKKLRPSSREELEITELNLAYLEQNALKVTPMDKNDKWLDTGTVESLLEASQFVKKVQTDHNILIGSPELAAFNSGAITREKLKTLSKELSDSAYGKALKKYVSNAH